MTMKRVLNSFCCKSSHRFNMQKNQIFFSKNVNHDLKVNISCSFGFSHEDNLGKYLEVLLLHQRVTKETFQYIVDNMRKKLARRKSKLLSLTGRITLAKVVLIVIPIYAMQSTNIPSGICHKMEKIIHSLVWGNTEEKKGMSLVK